MPDNPDDILSGGLVPSDPNRAALADPRVKGFLDKISQSEGADYNTLVGGRKINDLSRHPNVVGLTTSAGPSTAFGRYQITGTTNRTKLAKYKDLDYSPDNQDLRAVELLRQTKALDALQSGDEQTAIRRAGREWASLPGSPLPGRKNTRAFAQSATPQEPSILSGGLTTKPTQPIETPDILSGGLVEAQEPSRGAGMAQTKISPRPQVRSPRIVSPNDVTRLARGGMNAAQTSMAGSGAARARMSEGEQAKAGLRGLEEMSGSPTQLLPDTARDFINQTVAEGAAGLVRRGAGLVRTLPRDPTLRNDLVENASTSLRQGAQNIDQASAAIDREAVRPKVNVPLLGEVSTKDVQNIGSGAIASAPALILTRLGVPAPVAFGIDSYLESQGRGGDLKDALKQAGIGAATGALFEIPVSQRLGILSRIGAKLGIVGGGTYGIEKIVGMPESEARKNAAVNALFAASGAADREVKPEERTPIQTVPDELQNRLRMGDVRDQAQQAGAELLNPQEVIAGQKPKVRINANQTEAQPNIETNLAEQKPAVAQPISSTTSNLEDVGTPDNVRASTSEVGESISELRHVDLQKRRVRGDGKGQFRSESKAEREARLAQVNNKQEPSRVVGDALPEVRKAVSENPATVAEIAQRVNIAPWQVSRALVELRLRGEIEDTGGPTQTEPNRYFAQVSPPVTEDIQPAELNPSLPASTQPSVSTQVEAPTSPTGKAFSEDIKVGDYVRATGDKAISSVSGTVKKVNPKTLVIESQYMGKPMEISVRRDELRGTLNIARGNEWLSSEFTSPAPVEGEAAPQGKSFKVVWADGRAVQYFDNSGAANTFYETKSRTGDDPDTPALVDTPTGARVKSTFEPSPDDLKAIAASPPPVEPTARVQPKRVEEAPDTTGIAHRVETATRGEEPLRGESVGAEESVQRGRDLLAQSDDPGRLVAKTVTNFDKTGAVSPESIAIVRAQHEQLAQKANKAFDANGLNSPEFKAAEQARRNFYDNAVKPMQTAWSNTGRAQQGETAIDTGTFYGMYRAFRDTTGREMTPREQVTARRLSESSKAADELVSQTQQRLIDRLNSLCPPG